MAEKHEIKLSIPSQRFVVAPGQRLKVPVKLINSGSRTRDCVIKVEGIPDAWISSLPSSFQVTPGDPMTVELGLAPPRTSQSKVEFHHLKIIAIVLDAPENPVPVEANLMVGLLTVQDSLGILVASSNFSISPGEILQIPLFLINLGNAFEQLELGIQGLACEWVSLSETELSLGSGERKRVLMSLHPPRGAESRAGRRSFSVQFTKQAAPEAPLTLHCSLTIAATSELSCGLDPVNVYAGQPAQLQITNLGNIPQTCQVTLLSENPLVDFRPVPALSLRIPPGERANVSFSATLRHRRWLGGEMSHPYRVEVRTSENKNLVTSGLITSRARIPLALPEGLISAPGRFRHWASRVNWPLLFGGLILFVMIYLAVMGPTIALQDPMKENYAFRINGQIIRPPYPPFTIPGYPLGTDNFGRDLLSRILWGVRPTIIMVVTVALVRLLLGNLIGLLAGWSNGRAGRLLEGVITAAISIPVLIVALMGITAVGIRRGLIAFIIGLAITGWADTARYVSTQTKIIRHQSYIEAARGLGSSDFRILAQHIWKQLAPLMGMLFAFEVSSTLFVVAELGFLGYFIGGGTWIEISDFVVTNAQGLPELGQLLSSALVTLVRPTVLLIVGTIVFLSILGFNLLGEGLRIRAYQQVAGSNKLKRLLGERIGARIEGRYPLSVTDWMERYAGAVGFVVAILLVAAGWLIWNNSRPVKATVQNVSALAVPGRQLWAAEKHDAQGTYWTPASGPKSKQVAWRYQAPGDFSGGPVVLADGTIIVATQDQELVALNPRGDVIWQETLPALPVGSPALGPAGEIYVSGQDGSLLAYSRDGENLWQFTPENQREASSGPIVDSDGNIFYTLVDTIQAVNPDGKSRWAAYASDVYAEQPPVLSAGESYIFLLDKALAAENGIPLNLEGLPIEELRFTTPEFFVGADQGTYLRSGHEIFGWKNTETGLEVQPGITWPNQDTITMPPIEQGVTPDGLAWMFYTTDFNDSRLVWLDKDGKLIGNRRLPDRQSRLLGIDKDLAAYICSNNYGTNLRCEAMQAGENEPIWTLELGENINVVGGALTPGRLYIATDSGLLVAVGAP